MKPLVLLPALLDRCLSSPDRHPLLPEYRQIELYTKKKKLLFAPDQPRDRRLDGLADAQLAFFLLERHFAAQDEQLLEGLNSWERYLSLPRRNTLDKVAAELYRILRLIHIAGTHAAARLEVRDGLLRLSCDFKRCAHDLNITPVGLRLLGAAVRLYLEAGSQPYSEAYQEALLLQYFFDIVGEIRKFADEDRVLYQFHRRYPHFSRNFRFDCDNPKLSQDADSWTFEISPQYRDPVRYPIDFYVLHDSVLHIIPVEALQERRISTAELPRWLARTGPDGALPADFAMRFSREDMVVGLPMT